MVLPSSSLTTYTDHIYIILGQCRVCVPASHPPLFPANARLPISLTPVNESHNELASSRYFFRHSFAACRRSAAMSPLPCRFPHLRPLRRFRHLCSCFPRSLPSAVHVHVHVQALEPKDWTRHSSSPLPQGKRMHMSCSASWCAARRMTQSYRRWCFRRASVGALRPPPMMWIVRTVCASIVARGFRCYRCRGFGGGWNSIHFWKYDGNICGRTGCIRRWSRLRFLQICTKCQVQSIMTGMAHYDSRQKSLPIDVQLVSPWVCFAGHMKAVHKAHNACDTRKKPDAEHRNTSKLLLERHL